MAMNLKKMALLAEVAGGIGIIVSILYLAYEVSENTEGLALSHHLVLSEQVQDLEDNLLQNSELADIVRRGSDDLGQLDAKERYQFERYLLAWWNIWENAQFMAETGRLDAETWDGWNTALCRTTSLPGFADAWKSDLTRDHFNGDFRQIGDDCYASVPSSSGVAGNADLLAHFYKDVFENWDRDLVDKMLSPDFCSHDWPEGSRTGPDGFWDFYDGVLAAFPDTHYVVDRIVADDDLVTVHWHLLGTHLGDFAGMPPTGAPISLEGIAIYRIEGGKLMERWVVYDMYGLMQQVRSASAALD
jgi:steroid delta-isomerase-like uncharacterized protein